LSKKAGFLLKIYIFIFSAYQHFRCQMCFLFNWSKVNKRFIRIMITFNFKAKTSQGQSVAGTVESNSRESAVEMLKQKNYYLVSLNKQNALSGLFSSNFSFAKYVSVKEKAIFTHQLATMLKAGLQMTSALESLSKQTRSKQLTGVISQIHSDIEQSDSLSQAMGKHPRIFSKVYTSIIEAAEKSGSLPQTLAILSGQLKNQSSVNTRIKSALAYPIFLLAASVMVIGVLMTFVIPKFIALFVNANQKLPLPTRILVMVTNGFKEFWPALIIVSISGLCFILVLLKNKRVRAVVDGWMLKLPIVGSFNKKIQLARFTRTLGSLLAGGVRITSAIKTTAGTGGNIAFAGQIADIERSITKGSTLANAIRGQKFFSEVAANMISVGEETSTLPEMLDEIAQMHDEESEAAVNSLTTLLGPAMIVVLGLIIAFVVMAILMPIFETSTMIG